MDKVTTARKNLGTDTKTVLSNSSRLIEASALLICASYNFYDAYHMHINPIEFKLRIAASVVIGLRGAYELLRHLAQKEVK